MRSLIGALVLLFIVPFWDLSLGCPPSSPPPCSWQTCRHEWRNDWSPSSIPQGRCVNQWRRSHHIYSTHHGSGSCPSPSYCSSQEQRKATCSCRNAYYCPRHNWSGWSGTPPQGQCSSQRRYRDYNEYVRFLIRQSNCNGIQSSCGSREWASRPYCSCRYAECHVQQWSSWSVINPPRDGNCKTEKRQQNYQLVWKYKLQENCNGVEPQSCPGPNIVYREKAVYCPALPNPANGAYSDPTCTTNQQLCRTSCLLSCDEGNGYKRKGSSPAMTCMANGQWSGDAYCKDERAPSITCPSDILVGNILNKKHAQLTLPQPTVSDNSGKQPTVTTSVGGFVKEFQISQDAYEITYTARDANQNTKSCSFRVRVKDTQRPFVTKCPTKDIIKQDNTSPTRIVWDTPTFEDNYDDQLHIVNNYVSGSEFYYGRYNVRYVASDDEGNNATCEFYVQAGPVKCIEHKSPANGARACNIKMKGVENEMFCTVSCKESYYFTEDPADIYVCQSDGKWYYIKNPIPQNVPIQPEDKQPWPDCAKETTNTGVHKMFTVFAGACGAQEEVILTQIKDFFLKLINSNVLSKWMLCMSSNNADCVMDNVKVYCGKSKRSGDQAMQAISIDIVLKDISPSSDEQVEKDRVKLLETDMVNLATQLEQNLAQQVPIPGIHMEESDMSAACNPGEVPRVVSGSGPVVERSVCVSCGMGTYYNSATRNCDPCDEGSYQDEEGELQCKQCPQGKWTVEMRSKNETDCKDICEPGEHSLNGVVGVGRCMACPIGYYQPKTRQGNCVKCPSGTTTSSKGSVSASDCVATGGK